MTYDSELHHRRSIRLRGYDYSQAGLYFVTVCAQDRSCLFGEVTDGEMHLNEAGQMIVAEWEALRVRFPSVGLDEFCVMPNHIHGIVGLSYAVDDGAKRGATTRVAPTETAPSPVGAGLVPALSEAAVRLGDVVGAFKSLTTDLYIRGVKNLGWSCFRGRLWQRNYHEHIIRNEKVLDQTRRYILDNPIRWDLDPENPAVERPGSKTA